MGESAVQITNGQKPLTDLEKELWNIHQGLFGIMGMFRMIRQSAESDSSESQAAADIVEVLDQYIPIVDALRIQLDTAICRLK